MKYYWYLLPSLIIINSKFILIKIYHFKYLLLINLDTNYNITPKDFEFIINNEITVFNSLNIQNT